MPKEVWSYAFLVGHPNSDHSLIWRLSCDRDSNIYLYPRQSGSILQTKTTFHPPSSRWPEGKRHEALTSEFIRKHGIPERMRSRFLREWSGDKDLGEFGSVAYRLLFPASQLSRYPIPLNVGRPVKWLEAPPEGHTYVYDLIFSANDRQKFLSWQDAHGCAHIETWSMPDGRYCHIIVHILIDRPFSFNNSEFLFGSLQRLRDVRAANPEEFSRMRIALWTSFEGVPACADIAAEGLYRTVLTDVDGNEIVNDASALLDLMKL